MVDFLGFLLHTVDELDIHRKRNKNAKMLKQGDDR